MHREKRFFCLLLAVLAALSLSPSAWAAEGVNGVPRDAFEEKHAAESQADDHSYYLNGAPGYVAVYRSPVSGQITDYLLNEQLARVLYTWRDGKGAMWGQLRYDSLGSGVFRADSAGERVGWVKLAELTLRYDREQFVADHAAEFVQEAVVLDMRDYDEVYLWEYPGCGGRPERAAWYVREEGDNVLRFPAYWVDSLGRRWGGYSFFDADGFICLDDPGLEKNVLPEIAAEVCVIPAADGATLPRIGVVQAVSREHPALVWAAGGLAVAVLAAVFVLWRRRKPHRHEKS